MPLKVQRFYPAKLEIDGELIRLRIARLPLDAFTAFEQRFLEYGGQEELPPPADETPGDRAARQADAKRREREDVAPWLQDVFAQYVRVEAGDLVEVDDEDQTERVLTAGTDLLRLYAGRQDLVPRVLGLIWGENKLSEDQKKGWRSRFASERGWRETLASVRDGARPASTAIAAAPTATTASVAATDPGMDAVASSGTTDEAPTA